MGGFPVGYLKGRGKRGMNKTDKTRRKNTVLLNNSELTGSALLFFFFLLFWSAIGRRIHRPSSVRWILLTSSSALSELGVGVRVFFSLSHITPTPQTR